MIVRPPSRRLYRNVPTRDAFVGGFDGYVESATDVERAAFTGLVDLDADDVEMAGRFPGYGVWRAWACEAEPSELEGADGGRRVAVSVEDAVPHASSVGELAAIVAWSLGPVVDARACARAVWSRWGRRYAERMLAAWAAGDDDIVSLGEEVGETACRRLVRVLCPAGVGRRVRMALPSLARRGEGATRCLSALVEVAREVEGGWGARRGGPAAFGEPSVMAPDAVGLLESEPYAFVDLFWDRGASVACDIVRELDRAVIDDMGVPVDDGRRVSALARLAVERAMVVDGSVVVSVDDALTHVGAVSCEAGADVVREALSADEVPRGVERVAGGVSTSLAVGCERRIAMALGARAGCLDSDDFGYDASGILAACVGSGGCLVLDCEAGTDLGLLLGDAGCLDGERVVLLVPTGRAAASLSRALGTDVSTIASAVAHGVARLSQAEAVVVLESQAADVGQMATVCGLVGGSCAIVWVGDSAELGPVGVGSPFSDALSSGVVSTASVSAVGASRTLRSVRARVSDGDLDVVGDEALGLVDTGVLTEPEGGWLDAVVRDYADAVVERGADDVMLLCPWRRGAARLNVVAQDVLNPVHEGVWSRSGGREAMTSPGAVFRESGETTFRVGDRVACGRTDDEVTVIAGASWPGSFGEPAGRQGVCVGETGTVVAVVRDVRLGEGVWAAVRLDGRDADALVPAFAFGAPGGWSHAWAATVHATVGCRAGLMALVVPRERACTKGGRSFLDRALLLSALARALDGLRVWCEGATFAEACLRLPRARRNTLVDALAVAVASKES